jgi:hypothetical protein
MGSYILLFRLPSKENTQNDQILLKFFFEADSIPGTLKIKKKSQDNSQEIDPRYDVERLFLIPLVILHIVLKVF